jgi:hypothetical protein
MAVSPAAVACAARLAHDVGKHIERAALNLRDGEPVSPVLAALLLRDLYALAEGRRASERFAELAAGLGEAAGAEPIARCRELLVEIDRLEPSARARDHAALELAARHARQVAALLRGFARQLSEERP